jgi:hypothetical protein
MILTMSERGLNDLTLPLAILVCTAANDRSKEASVACAARGASNNDNANTNRAAGMMLL